MKLTETSCVPCRSDSPPVSQAEAQAYLQDLPHWSIISSDGIDQLLRTYSFKSYRECLGFTQQLGEMAEEADHHPKIILEWGKVSVYWWTHTIKGLHLNDFILAARSDVAYDSRL
ncbi:MAG: pterin-4-alpha-carbinolamine dehydratase [Gammaproteobacteria bacterium BRH_c0]|nr:MAG: pterin-4-alpha-carbinolamine dehydratase [Gammaproteobacteria bacterium BRH_c0]